MKTPRYCYDYPRPALTVDTIVWGYGHQKFHVLLIQRKNDPFKGLWALPGGFVDDNETAEQAAYRELREETNLDGHPVEQLYAVSELNRDPRGRTVSVIFYTFCFIDQVQPNAGDDASHLEWFAIDRLPALAFDHASILGKATNHLVKMARNLEIGPQLLRHSFDEKLIIDCYNAVSPGSGEKVTKVLKRTGAIIPATNRTGMFTFDNNKLRTIWQEGILYFIP